MVSLLRLSLISGISGISLLAFVSLVGTAAERSEFPAGFRWCVATSAHQIEGGNRHSDWWEWESVPGHIVNGDRSGVATDHWNRLEEDTALLKTLGVSEYRFSIEWAKVEPAPGQWDESVVEHYRRELGLLREAGIEPMVTLQHFSLPQWVAREGGWEWDELPKHFARYTQFVYKNIAPDVHDWITLNEPMVLLLASYSTGQFPPGKKLAPAQLVAPLTGMLRAHAAAYHALHAASVRRGTRIRVGVAHHMRAFDPATWLNPLDHVVTHFADEVTNWDFPDALQSGRLRLYIPFAVSADVTIPDLAGTQDFIGVNYYSRDLIQFAPSDPASFKILRDTHDPVSDLMWDIYPTGIRRVLGSVSSRYPHLPIVVTENGIADAKDVQRADFIDDHLREISRAIADGAQVEGYCHWSLLDNFEWQQGFWPRFGLYEVDYSTLHRHARPSALHYAEIIRANAVE